MEPKNVWRATSSAVATLAAAGGAMVKHSSEEREKWFEQMLAEITTPMRQWWAQLKEDYDNDPQQKREPRKRTPEDALHSFYVECKAAQVEPAKADEIRAKAKARFEEIRAESGIRFGVGVPSNEPVLIVIQGNVLGTVRLEKPKETPDELVELAINRVADACRKYWAEARAKDNT